MNKPVLPAWMLCAVVMSLVPVAVAQAQDPANVDAQRASGAPDPARIRANANATRDDSLRMLRQAEELQRGLTSRVRGSQALSAQQRDTMERMMRQGDGMIRKAWAQLEPASRDLYRQTFADTTLPPMADAAAPARRASSRAAQAWQKADQSPEARQMQAAMTDLQDLVLPYLRELRRDVDVELDRAANRRR